MVVVGGLTQGALPQVGDALPGGGALGLAGDQVTEGDGGVTGDGCGCGHGATLPQRVEGSASRARRVRRGAATLVG